MLSAIQRSSPVASLEKPAHVAVLADRDGGAKAMIFTDRLAALWRSYFVSPVATAFFAFRDPGGRFRPARAAERSTETPIRGEIAFADPRRLFPGAQPYATFNPSQLVGLKGMQVFDEMRRDDQVKAALAFKKF